MKPAVIIPLGNAISAIPKKKVMQKNMLNKAYATHPDMKDDNANFMSQYLQAQGVPYTGKWNIYKKSYGRPSNLR